MTTSDIIQAIGMDANNNDGDSRSIAATQAFLISMGVTVLIGISELGVWIISNNSLFFIEGFGNLIWTIPDFLLLVSIRYAGKKADFKMHYGYKRLETLTLLIFSSGIAAFALYFCYETLTTPPDNLNLEYGYLTIGYSLLVIGILFLLYRYLQAKGKAIHSKVILLDSMVIKADMASASVILASGFFQIITPLFTTIQTALTVLIALALFIYCINEWIRAAKELIDASPSLHILQLTEQIVEEMPDVVFISEHRIRSFGGAIAVDITIEADPAMTIQKAYAISRQIEDRVKLSVENVFEVQIRVHPVGSYLSKELTDQEVG